MKIYYFNTDGFNIIDLARKKKGIYLVEFYKGSRSYLFDTKLTEQKIDELRTEQGVDLVRIWN